MEQEVQALVIDNGSGMCKVKNSLSFFLFFLILILNHFIMFYCLIRLVLQVMMHHERCFHRLLVDHDTLVWWLVWVKRTRMSVMKHSRNEAFWRWSIRSSMVLWRIGMIWRRSGITRFTMSFVLHQKNIQFYWLKHHWIQK